jgi:UDP-2-acetamido-3-amino-2,3-dideoxy-glucuronate N-acetyltransferase
MELKVISKVYNMEYFAHDTAIIDEGCHIGPGTKIWHFCHIMKDCVLGKNCNLGQNVMIASGVILGSNVKVQNNVSIYTGVECEDDVFLGPSMVFTNIINPRSAISRKDQYKKTLVKKGATIGANATIICGIEIGEFALIGAGAVVTKDVSPYALVVGNPSQQIGWVSDHGNRLEFNADGVAFCKEGGQKYQLKNNHVVKL